MDPLVSHAWQDRLRRRYAVKAVLPYLTAPSWHQAMARDSFVPTISH
jgi:hypothetical protein